MAQKIIHKDLIQFKNLSEFFHFFLADSLGPQRASRPKYVDSFLSIICIMENIRTISHRNLYMKTWYSSKYWWILSDFLSSKCAIPHILLIPPCQNVLILFVKNIYILGTLGQFGTKIYRWRLDIVQNLCEFVNFSCLIFFGSKMC